MKRFLETLVATLFLPLALMASTDILTRIESPNGQIAVEVSLDAGKLFYTVWHKDQQVLKSSPLGLVTDQFDLSSDLSDPILQPVVEVSGEYEMWNAKQQQFRFTANRQQLRVSNSTGRELEVVFHVADDGVAFRYILPGNSQETHVIERESTGFAFPEDTVAWIQPMPQARTGWSKTQPSYEEHYLKEYPLEKLQGFLSEQWKRVEKADNLVDVYPFVGWVFPALFHNPETDTWVLLSETGIPENYCASRLVQEEAGREFRIGFPMRQEAVFDGPVKPTSTLPWKTPWRLIVVGDDLGTIVESTLGTDLAEPAAFSDTDWIRPGKASWSWVVLKDDSMKYDIQKRFIDYAARMGWEYTLIDTLWDQEIGYEKISELAEYARKRGVGLILWYNSSGPWNETTYTPKSALLTAEDREKEFQRLHEMGIKGIKVDFFPGDGQSVMKYYHDLMQSAAHHHLMVNFHGTTLPRGWQRTYPNLATMESVRGMEFITFTQHNADEGPTHMAVLPFTRNVFDPMDFTPMVFSELPNIRKRTLMGFELALPVLFHSGIQHLGETPEGMERQPDFIREFLGRMPTVWDETKLISGYPGKYAVLARRSGKKWYISGINATGQPLPLNFKLPASPASGKAVLLTDDEEEDRLVRREITPAEDEQVSLTVRNNGGFVLHFSVD